MAKNDAISPLSSCAPPLSADLPAGAAKYRTEELSEDWMLSLRVGASEDMRKCLVEVSAAHAPCPSLGLLLELFWPYEREYRELEYRLIRLGVGDDDRGIAEVPGTAIG
jgi:hypothetical protein